MMINRRIKSVVILGLTLLAITGCSNKVDKKISDIVKPTNIASDINSNILMKKVQFNGLKKYINMNIESGDVTIKKSPDNDIHVEYADGVGVRVEEMGSMICIIFEGDTNKVNIKDLAVIHVPDVFVGEITGDFENSNIAVSDIKNVAKVDFELENGNMECKNVVAENISFDTENGNINIENIDATKSIKIESENGNIEGSFASDINKYNLTTDIEGNSNIPKSNKVEGTKLHIANENGEVNIK